MSGEKIGPTWTSSPFITGMTTNIIPVNRYSVVIMTTPVVNAYTGDSVRIRVAQVMRLSLFGFSALKVAPLCIISTLLAKN